MGRVGRLVFERANNDALDSVIADGAGRAWSGLVEGAHLDPARVKPVRGQMMELQLRAPLFTRLLKSANGYVVPRADGSVLVGSTMEMVGFDKNVTAEGLSKLLAAAIQLTPQLASAPVTSTCAGLRPWTSDQLPFLGEGAKAGLLLATGHFRNGILLAPITARHYATMPRAHPAAHSATKCHRSRENGLPALSQTVTSTPAGRNNQ